MKNPRFPLIEVAGGRYVKASLSALHKMDKYSPITQVYTSGRID